MGGCCYSSDRNTTELDPEKLLLRSQITKSFDIPEEETQIVLECEANLKLYMIDYPRYKIAVMRYGFTGKMN